MSVFQYRNTRSARLTPGQVMEIRRRYQGGETQAALSREYGVSVVQVGRIVRQESWQSLPEASPPMALPAELEAAAKRLMELQKRESPYAAIREQGDSPPPSLLDGGDAASETDGRALDEMSKALKDRDADGLLEELKDE